MKCLLRLLVCIPLLMNSCFDSGHIATCSFDNAIKLAVDNGEYAIIAVGGVDICQETSALQRSLDIQDYIFYSCDITLKENIHANYCFKFKEFPSYIIIHPTVGVFDICSTQELKSGILSHFEHSATYKYIDESKRLYRAYSALSELDSVAIGEFVDFLEPINEFQFYFYYLQYKAAKAMGYSNEEEFLKKAITLYLEDPNPIYSLLFSELLELSKTDCATILIDEDVELGVINKNSIIEYRLPYLNVGNEPLLIYHASVSCDCVSVEWDRITKSGEQREILIRVNAGGDIGEFQRTVFMAANTLDGGILINLSGQII